jgi:spermidine/putrescine transport system permease protein
VPVPPAAGGRRRHRRGLATLGLLSSPLAYLGLFFLLPVALVAAYSVGALTLLPQDLYLSLRPWQDFLGSSVYTGLFWKSVQISLTVSVVCVLMAYPVAYFLSMVAGKRRYVLLLLTIAPFLTSYLLRVLAWRVILGEEGVINSLLVTVGLRGADDPVRWLIYSPFAVYLVLAYVWVPFVALPMFVSLDSLDRSLMEASSDLGASRWTTFRRITLPMSVPGIVAAFIFVFIPTIGEYVTPLLVGGPNGTMFGNAIQTAFLQGFDWQFGSAMGMFLIAVVAILIAVFGRFLNTGAVTE